VLAGGGVKGLAELGALHVLLPSLAGVRLVVGSSVGAVVGAAFALGLDPRAFLEAAQAARYRPTLDIGLLLQGGGGGFGMDSGEGLDGWLARALGPAAAELTLEGVRRERGVALVVCATDLYARGPVYLGPDTHPDLPLLRALRLTCSIPLLYAAVPMGEALLVDGALADNFPVAWTLRASGLRPRDLLGVGFRYPRAPPARSLDQFLLALAAFCMGRQPPPPRGVPLLLLDVGHQSAAEFDMPAERMAALFDAGADQARLFLKKNA